MVELSFIIILIIGKFVLLSMYAHCVRLAMREYMLAIKGIRKMTLYHALSIINNYHHSRANICHAKSLLFNRIGHCMVDAKKM